MGQGRRMNNGNTTVSSPPQAYRDCDLATIACLAARELDRLPRQPDQPLWALQSLVEFVDKSVGTADNGPIRLAPGAARVFSKAVRRLRDRQGPGTMADLLDGAVELKGRLRSVLYDQGHFAAERVDEVHQMRDVCVELCRSASALRPPIDNHRRFDQSR